MGWFKRLLGDEELTEVAIPKRRAPRRNFNKLYPLDAEVFLKVTTNPKRRGTDARRLYKGYASCTTVKDCLDTGMTYRNIDGDVQRGYIEVGKSGS